MFFWKYSCIYQFLFIIFLFLVFYKNFCVLKNIFLGFFSFRWKLITSIRFTFISCLQLISFPLRHLTVQKRKTTTFFRNHNPSFLWNFVVSGSYNFGHQNLRCYILSKIKNIYERNWKEYVNDKHLQEKWKSIWADLLIGITSTFSTSYESVYSCKGKITWRVNQQQKRRKNWMKQMCKWELQSCCIKWDDWGKFK